MLHKFPYKEFEPVEIPDALISGIYTPGDSLSSANNTEIIESALNNPTGSQQLNYEVKPGMKVVIAVDDYSRSTRTELMLPIVLNRLEAAGIPAEDVSVFIALGTHRKMTTKEMEQKYTCDAVKKYRFINPDWKDSTAYLNAGNSSYDFQIKIHKEILKADFVIGVGQTIPHMIAGFGGGCKIINPGCADADTIGTMHWLCSQVPPGKLFAVRDNAVRKVIDEVGLKAGLKFILNEVPGTNGKLAGAFAGHPVKAHQIACEFAAEICRVDIREKTDIVIADSFPSDSDFWQALKGLNAAYGAVKDGGTVILVSPCPEGASLQHPELTKFGYLPIEKTEDMVLKGTLDKAVAGNFLLGRQLLDKARTILVTKGIPEKDTKNMGFDWAASPAAALKKALNCHGKNAAINILYKASKMICAVKK